MNTRHGEPPATAWIEQSLLFRRGTQLREQILRHKQRESEKSGRDVDWDRASVDWLIRECLSRRGQ